MLLVSSLPGLGGGLFAFLIAADKAKRPLCPFLQAVCELQWNFEQVKQHIVCVADVLVTNSSAVDFLSSNCETGMTSICFYWWWRHLSGI